MGQREPVFCVLLLLGACASTPDVTIQYYPAKSVTTFTTTQNLACTHDSETLIVTNAVSATTEYSADTTKPPQTLRLKDLDNPLADASLSVDLFGDGRLKSINATTTGQGQAVISAAAGIVGIAAPRLGSSGGPAPLKLPICAVLKNWPDGKATLTFARSVDLAQMDVPTLPLNDDNAAVSDPVLYAEAAGVLPEVLLTVSNTSPVPRPASAVQSANTAPLTLHDTSLVQADFTSFDRIGSGRRKHWLGTKTFVVPGPGDYLLPVPRAAPFGGSQFSLTLSESGAVTALSYGKTSGAPAAFGAANSAVTAITPTPLPTP